MRTSRLVSLFVARYLTIARGVNDRGDVVGPFMGRFTASGGGNRYSYTNGKYVQLDFPGTGAESTNTFPWASIMRNHCRPIHTTQVATGHTGFVFSDGKWARVDRRRRSSAVNGVNEAGETVGIWFDSEQNEHSFRFQDARFASIDVPNATRTLVDALLDS